MSAYDNLAVKCKLFGMDEKKYIENVLDRVGLSKVGKKKVKHFSSWHETASWHRTGISGRTGFTGVRRAY